MESETVPVEEGMLPPKNCIPRNYSCMAGLFGSLAAAGQRKEDGEEDTDDDHCEKLENHVVDERPRGRECFPRPPQSPTTRRRCKSLPITTEGGRLEISRRRSPATQKRVRFADSLGLELTSVKHFCDADVPEVPQRVLDIFKKENDLHLSIFEKIPRTPLKSSFAEADFSNPGQLPGFLEEVKRMKVLLECVETDDFSMTGLIRVLNVSFEKTVILRYSFNNWVTYLDFIASYVPESSDGLTDKFSFKITSPLFLETGNSLLFAIKYCAAGEEFWDNNYGNNYKIGRQRFKISPPMDWENGWIHFI